MAEGVVVVTGGSRGIGAEIAIESARLGNDVVVGYHNKAPRALKIVDRIHRLGRQAIAIQADITDPEAILGMLGQAHDFATAQGSELGTLVLNAAGGLEPDSTYESAEHMNAESQYLLAFSFLKNEKLSGHAEQTKNVVYLTSHPSHFYMHPHNALPVPQYDLVAATKYRGEQMLRDRIDADAADVHARLLVVSADIVTGTAGHTLLERAYRQHRIQEAKALLASGEHQDADLLERAKQASLTDERNEQLYKLIGQGLPTAALLGCIVVDAFMNPDLSHGHTTYAPRPVLGTYVIPAAELPFGVSDPTMYTFFRQVSLNDAQPKNRVVA